MVTGGGPGIMEAANRGAFEAGGISLGMAIKLPKEQAVNKYLTNYVEFEYFFSRKTLLYFSAESYVYFPGGFGTLDEMTEMVTLVQTGKIPANVPIILFGKAYWGPFLEWMKQVTCKQHHFVEKKEMDIIHLVDTTDEVVKIIQKTFERPFG